MSASSSRGVLAGPGISLSILDTPGSRWLYRGTIDELSPPSGLGLELLLDCLEELLEAYPLHSSVLLVLRPSRTRENLDILHTFR